MMKLKFMLSMILVTSLHLGCSQAEESKPISPYGLFVSPDYEVSQSDFSIDILGFRIWKGIRTFSVVKITEYPANKATYKLYVTEGDGHAEYVLDEMDGLSGVQLGKMGMNEQGDLYIPFTVEDRLELYRLASSSVSSDSTEIAHITVTAARDKIFTAAYDSGILAIQNHTGQIKFAFSSEIDKLFLSKVKDTSLFHALEIEGVNDLYDIKAAGEAIHLIVNGKNGPFLYVFDAENKLIEKKLRLTGVNGVATKIKIESMYDNMLVLSQVPDRYPSHKAYARVISVDSESGAVEQRSLETDNASAIGLAFDCGKKASPILITNQRAKAGDGLFIDSDTKRIELKLGLKVYFYRLALETDGGIAYALAVYDAIRDETSYPTLALLEINDVYSCK